MEKLSNTMYREHILELYKNPQNFGELKKPTHKYTEFNSLCGDELTIQLVIEDDKIKDVKFNGSGCVISLVSASLLTNRVKGMEIREVKKLDRKDIIDLLKIKISPARMKCALLSLEAVRKALK